MLSVSILIAGIFGCTERSSQGDLTTIRDSAGVRIVENGPPIWPDGHLWTLDPEPLIDIGGNEDDESQFFYRVRGVFQAPSSGEIFIANQGTREVLVFDSLGVFRRRIGGRGEGPGELMGLSGIYPCGSTGFLVDEDLRVSRFDLAGVFLDSRRPRRNAGALRVEGVSSDCSALMLVSWPILPPPEGVVGSLTGTIHWQDQATEVRKSMVSFPRAEVLGRTIDGYLGLFPFPWAQAAEWAVWENQVFLGTSEHFEIRVFDPKVGLVEVIRWKAAVPLITGADRRRYERERDRIVSADPGSAPFYPRLEDVHVADRKPTHASLIVDAEGNLWVEEYPAWAAGMKWALWGGAPDDPPVRWTVFNPDGRLLGFVDLPADVRVMEIGDDRLIGVWRDDLDTEHVRLYRLNKR